MAAAMTEAVVTALVLLAAVVTVEVNVMAAAAKAVAVVTVAAAAFPDKPDRHRRTPVDSYR